MIGQAVKVIVRLMRQPSSELKEGLFLPMVTTMICATMLITHLRRLSLFLSHHRTATILQLALWIVRGVTQTRQLFLWLRLLCHHDLMTDTHQDRSTILMVSHRLVPPPTIAISISRLDRILIMFITTLCCLLIFTHLNYIILMLCNHVIRQINL